MKDFGIQKRQSMQKMQTTTADGPEPIHLNSQVVYLKVREDKNQQLASNDGAATLKRNKNSQVVWSRPNLYNSPIQGDPRLSDL